MRENSLCRRFPKHWLLPRACLAGLAVFAGMLVIGLPFYIPRAVRVEVLLGAPVSGGVQVYYRTDPTGNFRQERSIHARMRGVPVIARADIPSRQLHGLRIDFGSEPGDVSIRGGNVGDFPLPQWKYWSFSRDVTLKSDVGESGELKLFSDKKDPNMAVALRRAIPARRTFNSQRFTLLLTLAVAISLATVVAIGRQSGNTDSTGWNYGGWDCPFFIGLTVPELAFLFLCAAYYALWVSQPLDFSPDEAIRYKVTRFLFDHGRLPMDTEAISEKWGFSYAHMPTMFCNVLGVIFMKISAWFTSDGTILLRTARILGVFCITGTVYWTIRTSRLLFKAPFNWLPVCIVAFLPQFAYIGSYVNNDSAALLGCSMVLFSWVSAIDRRWDYRNAAILAIGIAICATSYYNSYAWILFSLPMFPLTYIARNGRTGLVKMSLFVSVIAFCLGGYLFLRHLRLYGDLLGFATAKRFALENAAPDYLPGVRLSPCERGWSLPYMLFDSKWLSRSAMSFVGYFGYMLYPIPDWCYTAYAWVFGVGAFGVLWKGTDWIRGWKCVGVCKWSLLVSLIGCMAITIGLSVYYSFARDYEPQGRYCFPALLPMALLSAKGLERIVNGTIARRIKYFVVFVVCLLLGLVSETSYLFFRNLFYSEAVL